MAKIFEDEFMELQSGIISLCLELVQDRADKVYAYGSIEKKSTSFNAFFEVNGEIKTISKIVPNENAIWEFLSLGGSDLEEMRALGEKYKQPIPTELKMVYDVKTGKFDATYKYEPVCTGDTGIDQSQIIYDWVDEMKEKLKNQ